MRAVNPYEMRLPLSVDDVDAALYGAGVDVTDAACALRNAGAALSMSEWVTLHAYLEAAIDRLDDARKALEEARSEARRWADHAQGDW